MLLQKTAQYRDLPWVELILRNERVELFFANERLPYGDALFNIFASVIDSNSNKCRHAAEIARISDVYLSNISAGHVIFYEIFQFIMEHVGRKCRIVTCCEEIDTESFNNFTEGAWIYRACLGDCMEKSGRNSKFKGYCVKNIYRFFPLVFAYLPFGCQNLFLNTLPCLPASPERCDDRKARCEGGAQPVYNVYEVCAGVCARRSANGYTKPAARDGRGDQHQLAVIFLLIHRCRAWFAVEHRSYA